MRYDHHLDQSTAKKKERMYINFPYEHFSKPIHIKLSESPIVSVYRHTLCVLKYYLKYQKKNTSYMFIVSVIDFRLLLS